MPPRAVVPVEQQVVLVLADMNDPPQVPRLKARLIEQRATVARSGLEVPRKVHRIVDPRRAGRPPPPAAAAAPARPRAARHRPSASSSGAVGGGRSSGSTGHGSSSTAASPVLGPSAGPGVRRRELLIGRVARGCERNARAFAASSYEAAFFAPANCYARANLMLFLLQ